MLRTALCNLLGIEHPVIQEGMGVFTAAPLVVAVSNAGGLGSIGSSQRSAEDLRRQIAQIQEMPNKPFAVNHLVTNLNEEAFASDACGAAEGHLVCPWEPRPAGEACARWGKPGHPAGAHGTAGAGGRRAWR
ncbi:MAG: hypothetical protein FJ315_05820 [SAR202 cluster bacterium]|nr:hypothetical protein [SAR202 cluster bacterium]